MSSIRNSIIERTLSGPKGHAIIDVPDLMKRTKSKSTVPVYRRNLVNDLHVAGYKTIKTGNKNLVLVSWI